MNEQQETEIKEFQAYLEAEAKSQNKDPKTYIQNLGEDGLKEAYKRFQTWKQKKAKKAAHGMKLNYIKSLKHQCADDEVLVYYKQGGSMGCKCKKAQEGTEMPSPQQKIVVKSSLKQKKLSHNKYRNGGILKMQGGSNPDWSELIPIYGTYKIGKRFFKNPTWRGAGELALSTAGDLATLTGVGAGVGTMLKAGKAAATAGKVAKTASAFKKAKAANNLRASRQFSMSGSYADDALELAGDMASKTAAKQAIARGAAADKAANYAQLGKAFANEGAFAGASNAYTKYMMKK